MPIFSTLFAIRASQRHRCCVMECVRGRWCRIQQGYASLHETLIAILLHGWRLKRQTNGGTITDGGQKPTLENTTDFMNKLRRLPRLPSGCLVVPLDVSSLYTNVPHKEGITACEGFLYHREIQEPPTADLCQLIRLVLSKNSFVFNNRNYLQIHGTAMGTRMAPSYANLFMGKLEREFLRTQNKLPLVWWRYIDDIFAIWTHGEPSL